MVLLALTVFLGAFLLFQIQPIIAKQILPWFGGAANVWTTCMVFFQVALLLGYLYAHAIIAKLTPRRQSVLHLSLLVLSLLSLPVVPDAAWKPDGAGQPMLRIVGLLAVTVGLPYLLLSATGPLLQAWYARRDRTAVPYRLYSLSNVASLLGLLAYPFVIEPNIGMTTQANVWSASYVAFALLCGVIAYTAGFSSNPGKTKVAPQAEALPASPPPDWRLMALWMLLATWPSLLLLAVTNFITQNIASIPFLWIPPLCVYLFSFVLCFDRDDWYRPKLFSGLLAVALAGMGYLIWTPELSADLRLSIPALLVGLFVCCMFGHGELARRKPEPRYLTSFYFMVALGGATGGLLVSVVAPLVFPGYYELPVGLAVLGLFTLFLLYRRSVVQDLVWASVAVFLVVTVSVYIRSSRENNVTMERNFYGSLRVVDTPGQDGHEPFRTMIHGTIKHGTQFLSASLRSEPTAYFGRTSGIGLALTQVRRSPIKVGVIGLGAGTLAAYGQPGDHFRFYEINPLVVKQAHEYFTYLGDSGAKVDIVLGDGRLSLEREAPQHYDVLVVDAFSGDSIPVHLLTLRAFKLYFSHLKPNGVLALHISNSMLDLPPIVEKAARRYECRSLLVEDPGNEANGTSESTWAVLTRDPQLLRTPPLAAAGKPLPARPELRAWTDDYTNLFDILR